MGAWASKARVRESGAIARDRYDWATFGASARVSNGLGEEFGAPARHLAPVVHDSFGDDDAGMGVGYAGYGWIEVVGLVGHGVDPFVQFD